MNQVNNDSYVTMSQLVASFGVENVGWRSWQAELPGPSGEAFRLSKTQPTWDNAYRYEFFALNRAHAVPRAKVSKPLDTLPADGDLYWTIELDALAPVVQRTWASSVRDGRLFTRGLCFAAESDAADNYTAMVDRT